MVEIQIRGLEQLNKYLLNLPKKMSASLKETNEQFMKDVKKSAKLRAPRDSGRMAKSIKIERTKNTKDSSQWRLIVDSPYAIFQELGFAPHVFLTDPGRPGFKSSKLPLGKFVLVKKNTPFIIPALDANLAKLSKKLNQGAERGLK